MKYRPRGSKIRYFEVRFESVEPESQGPDSVWRPERRHRSRMVVIADTPEEARSYVTDASSFPVDRFLETIEDPDMPTIQPPPSAWD